MRQKDWEKYGVKVPIRKELRDAIRRAVDEKSVLGACAVLVALADEVEARAQRLDVRGLVDDSAYWYAFEGELRALAEKCF